MSVDLARCAVACVAALRGASPDDLDAAILALLCCEGVSEGRPEVVRLYTRARRLLEGEQLERQLDRDLAASPVVTGGAQ